MRDWSADTRIYKLNPPYEDHKYVLVVAASVSDGFEMITWGCDSKGRFKRYTRLPGCHRRNDKHFEATLERMGYVLKKDIHREPK